MLKFLCSALVILGSGALFATIHPSPGGWGITGEYLYLMPTVDDTYFVISSPETTTFPNGKRINNEFNFDSGYRVGGVYAFCECDREISVAYSYLSNKRNKTVTGDFLWATLGNPDFASSFENYTGTAHSHLNLRYERLDALFAQKVYDCCDLSLRLQFGLEYAQLKLHENHTYESTVIGTTSQNSKAWGVGPQLGVEVDYQICQFYDCMPGILSFNVISSGSILAGETKTSVTNVLTGATILDVSDRKGCRVIPAFHTRFGFNYATCLCGYGMNIEVGYEFNSYYRGLARTVFPDDVADGLCTTQYYNYDVQGLYVSASVSF